MNTLRTVDGFQDCLDKEFSWRMQELSQLSLAVRSANGSQQRTLIRSGITMLYAHWEGFVKTATSYYLEHIDKKAMTYSQLKTCFVALGMRKQLHELSDTKQHRLRVETLEFIMDEMSSRASIAGKSAVDTRANLNSEVLKNILCVVGLAQTAYESKYNLIDESMLARRNRIAHGEFLDVDRDQYLALGAEIVNLMRAFKTDIENAVSLESYRK